MTNYEKNDQMPNFKFSEPVFYMLQWIWGLPVNLIGLLAFLFCQLKGWRTEKFGYAYIAYVPWKSGGLTLGLFIFMRENHPNETWTYNTRIHEYGHTWQTLTLGVLYWIVIAIPSFIWCNCFEGYRRKNNKSYYVFYPEKWANFAGQKATGLQMIIPEPRLERSEEPWDMPVADADAPEDAPEAVEPAPPAAPPAAPQIPDLPQTPPPVDDWDFLA
ncbi:MAG: hypothetical protein IK080_06910 [Clostridia bacterium]|nr:hypothetical protein [Clostridia bacterium]